MDKEKSHTDHIDEMSLLHDHERRNIFYTTQGSQSEFDAYVKSFNDISNDNVYSLRKSRHVDSEDFDRYVDAIISNDPDSIILVRTDENSVSSDESTDNNQNQLLSYLMLRRLLKNDHNKITRHGTKDLDIYQINASHNICGQLKHIDDIHFQVNLSFFDTVREIFPSNLDVLINGDLFSTNPYGNIDHVELPYGRTQIEIVDSDYLQDVYVINLTTQDNQDEYNFNISFRKKIYDVDSTLRLFTNDVFSYDFLQCDEVNIPNPDMINIPISIQLNKTFIEYTKNKINHSDLTSCIINSSVTFDSSEFGQVTVS